jgi:uncharacterized protein (TIGR03083 family)
MTDPAVPDQRLVQLVETWHRACTDFVALAREIPPQQWHLPTDLDGWCVKDNVAHTAHLEAVLAGAPEETLEVAEAPHLKSLMGYYTEQGVLARRDRDMETIATELEHAVEARYAALQDDPPTDPKAAPPKTPGGVPWDFQTLLGNRPFDVWMHEQDIRRATDRPGGYDSPVAGHVLRTLGRSLPMVVGKRVAPPVGTTVRLEVPEAGLAWSVRVGDDGRATPADDATGATATVTLSAEDFVVLGGGRRSPDATQPRLTGDEEIGRRLVESLAVTP